MKKALRLSALLIVVFALVLLASCEQDPIVQITPTPTIRGTVSIPESAGLSGSDFYVRIIEGEKAVYTGRVNADGSFAVPGLSEEASYSILLTTEEPGDIKGSEKDISRAITSGYGGWLSNVTASINEQAGVGSIKVKPLGTIKGIVTKDGADDGYDTTVYIPGTSYLAMTDGQGNFSIFNVPQATYTLRYISNGYMAKMVSDVVLYSDSDTENPVTTVASQILIKNAGNLLGTITKTGSTDHSNITVRLSDGKNTYTEGTATDGTLLITGIEPSTYAATISSSGFITQTVEGIVIEAAKNTTISPISLVANGGTITGSVVMNDGGSKAGVLITAKSNDEKYSYTTSTDENGSFTIPNAYPETYTLTLTKTGYAIITRSGIQSVAGQSTNAGEFSFSSDFGTIEGTITDTKGNPIENAIIKIGEINILTTVNGSFSKTGIGLGNYTVTVSKDGYSTKTLSGEITIESSMLTDIGTVQLASVYGSITGSITVNDNKTLEGIHISAVSSDGKNSYSTMTNAEGMYFLSNVVSGQYSLSAKQLGYTDTSDTVVVDADKQSVAPTLYLAAKYGSISGKVSLADSVDNSGVIITLKSIDDESIAPATLSGVDGIYTFDNLSVAGQYAVTFSKEGFVSNSGKTIFVELGKNFTIEDVVLGSLASKVMGSISLEGTENYTGIAVLLTDNQDNQYNTTTDSRGTYVLNGVIPGNYDLYVSKTGYETKVISGVVVGSSITKELDSVQLAAKIKSITGSITLEGRDDYAGALVTATNINDEELVYSAITNSDGNYTLAGMIAGEYRIVITNATYRTETLRTVRLTDEPITMDRVDLSIARGTIYGSVTLEGRTDYSGVTVQIIGKTGSDYTTTTDANGDYSFYVPQGNYAGVRFSKEDFTTETSSTVISLFAENNVPVENIRLAATHVSVFGYVDVQSTEDEANVKISIDGTDTLPAVTGQDGFFRFDHLPVDVSYTFRFERENTATITVRVDTKPSDGIQVKDIVMVPDSAGIEGIVRLDSALNNGDVVVQINTGYDILSTTTNSAGDYYIGGIPTGRELTINYSKEGWETVSQTVEGLIPLEVRTINPITLSDITPPSLNSITINGGANVTGSKLVSVTVNADEKGSGLSEMRYYWNNDSSTAKWVYYSKSFKTELPDETNGTYSLSLEVKDAAGNVSSSVVTDSIELVGQITTIQPGVLSGENLHWQAKDNPIVIMGDVIVQSKDTLVIDPGVDVLFNGDYSIRVLGKIQAVGTIDLPIVFDSSKDHLADSYQNLEIEGYYGYWGGIIVSNDSLNVSNEGLSNYTFIDGSILSFCNVYNISRGVSGKVFINNCRIETQRSAIGSYSNGNHFSGYLLNSFISGGVSMNNYSRYGVVGNTFDGTNLSDEPEFEYSNHWESGDRERVAKNWHEYGYDSEGNYQSNDICEFDFNGIYIEGFEIINNRITDYNAVRINPSWKMQFNTVEFCRSLSIVNDDGSEYSRYNDIHDITDTVFYQGSYAFTFNNIYSVLADNTVTIIGGNSNSFVDFSHNYWGEHTAELEAIDKYGYGTASFVYDGYSNSSISIMDFSHYSTVPWSFTGYQGSNLVEFKASFIPEVSGYNEAKVGNSVYLNLESIGSSQVAYYRIGQTFEELNSSLFVPYYGVCSYESSEIDLEKIEDGLLKLYVQIKTDSGVVSPVEIVSIGYDKPYAYDIKLQSGALIDGLTLSNDGTIAWQWSLHNASGGTDSRVRFVLYVDDQFITDETWSVNNTWTGQNNGWIDLSNMKNGTHVIRFIVSDGVGDSSTTEAHFIVQKKAVGVSSISLEAGTVIGESQSMDFSVTTDNSSKLKEIRVYSDSNILAVRTFNNGNSYLVKTEFSVGNQYLSAGNHILYIEVEDYSGNVSRTEGIPFTVEGVPGVGPEIETVSLQNGITVGNTGTITVTATSTKGVKSLYVKHGDEIIGSNDGRYLSYSSDYNSRTISATVDYSGCMDGQTNLSIVVVDFAGNESSVFRTVNVEKSYPAVNTTVYDKQSSFYVGISIPNSSVINEINIYAGNVIVGNFDCSAYSGGYSNNLTVEKAAFSDGTYEIRIELVNNLGESIMLSSGSYVVIDSTKPFEENNLEGITTFSGMLRDSERLHWTESMSPIVITGDLIVASDRTLTIDPGVKVYFDGDYSISVRGYIDARGTKEKPIVFRSSGNLIENHEGYYGNWGGIAILSDSLSVGISNYSCSYVSGNIMTNCSFLEMSTGIVGKLYLDSCYLSSNDFALGNESYSFEGIIINSSVHGLSNIYHSSFVFNNTFEGNPNSKTGNYGFRYYTYDGNHKFINNYIAEYDKVYLHSDWAQFEFNTIESIGKLQLDYCYSMKNNVVNNIKTQLEFGNSYSGMQFSNITNLTGNPSIVVNSKWNEQSSFEFTNNYWGIANTIELERASKSSNNNATFIYDGYDDDDYSVVNWSDFVGDPWSFAGYKGNSFTTIDASFTGSEVRRGREISISITALTENQVDSVRVSQTIEGLQQAEYRNLFGGKVILPTSSFDADKLDQDGNLTFYVQGRSGDTDTSIRTVKVPYDCPRLGMISISPGAVFRSDSPVNVTYILSDAYIENFRYCRTYIDGEYFMDIHTGIWGEHQFVIDPSLYKNGGHVLSVYLEDQAGNNSTTEIPFVVARPTPSVSEISLSSTDLAEGENLNVNFSIGNAAHLKKLELRTESNVIYTEEFNDGNSSTITKNLTIDSHYLPSGDNTVFVSLEDYSGNTYTSDSLSFRVDGSVVPPVLSGLSIEDGHIFTESDKIYLNLTASDDSGVRSLKVLLNDKVIYNVDTPRYSSSLNSRIFVINEKVVDYKNGNYTLTVSTSDFAGNTTNESRNIVINKSLPELTISSTENDGELELSYSIENRNYINGIELFMDGSAIDSTVWNYSAGHDSSFSSELLIVENSLSSGTHKFKYIATSHAGDIIESPELEIEIAEGRKPYDGQFGLNKSWNIDGSLIADSATRFLWGYNDPVTSNIESVHGKQYSDVKDIMPGIGYAGARASVSTGTRVLFPESEYTIEFWYLYEEDFNLYIDSDTRFWVGYNIHLQPESLNTSTSVMDYGGDKKWHYIAITGDSTGTKIYVDGVKGIDSSYARNSGFGKIFIDRQTRIDEFRISDCIRSEQEIAQYYSYVINNDLTNRGDLFDLDVGVSLYDLSSFVCELQADNTYQLSGNAILKVSANRGNPVLYSYTTDPNDFRLDVDALNWIPMSSDESITLDGSSLDNPVVYFQFLDSYGNRSLVKSVNLSFVIGQRGPAGGYIFYDCDADNKSGNTDGLISSECGWRFLEAAPEELDTHYILYGYYRTEATGSNLFVNGTTTYDPDNCTGTAIGTGKHNTELIVAALGEKAYSSTSGSGQEAVYAAKLCYDLEYTVDGNTFDDWFLPSKDELNEMYNSLYLNGIGGFRDWEYWSSSEYAESVTQGWEQNFPTGEQWWTAGGRCDYDTVRPIRAF